MTPPINSVSVDDLAQEIRRIDGNNEKGAGELAEGIMAFLAARRAANTPVDGVTPDIAALLAEPPLPSGLPRAYGGCTCSCHRMPGVMHIAPCCHPGDEQSKPLMTREWFERRSKDEEGLDVSVGLASPALPSQVVGVSLADAATALERSLESEDSGVNAYLRDDIEQAIAVMRSCLTSPAAEPVGWVTQDGIDYLKRGFGIAISAEKRPTMGRIVPLYTHPAPSASREVTERIRAILDHPSGSPEHDLGAIRAALLAALPEREG